QHGRTSPCFYIKIMRNRFAMNWEGVPGGLVDPTMTMAEQEGRKPSIYYRGRMIPSYHGRAGAGCLS
ncbi:MAG TPA: hypothetical protein PK154_06730, partial [Methanoregulaceae archaeon]|nr:hypothetical protein [Methanoregulaceae archaeon]